MPTADQVVIFDVFQTLLDFDGDHVDGAAWEFMATWGRYRGRDWEPAGLRQAHTQQEATLLAAAAGDPPDLDVTDLWAKLLDVRTRHPLAAEAALLWRQVTTRRLALHAGTIEMLDGLAAHRLAIVSNTQRAYTEHELAMLGIAARFEVVVFSSDVTACKPDPLPFTTALALLDVSPGDCVYVGDNPYDDVVGARGVGMPVVLLERGHPAGAMPGLPAPDAVVPGVDPARVVSEVKRLLAR